MSHTLITALWAAVGLAGGVLIAFAASPRERDVAAPQQITHVVVTGALVGILAWRHGSSGLDLSGAVGYTTAAVPLAGLDLRTGRLPNWLMLLAYLLALVGLFGATLEHPRGGPLLAALAGALVFAALYGTWYVLLPNQMGGGDVKLSIISGAVFGWQSWSALTTAQPAAMSLRLLIWLSAALLLIWLLQAVTYGAARVITRQRQEMAVRHGPFLVLGTILALLLVP